MDTLTGSGTRSLMEAYTAVYNQELREELVEERELVNELALEMIENASYILFSQGYGVNDVISYFTKASNHTIVEDYINFEEGNLIIESFAVSDQYIEEQFEILNEGIIDAGLNLIRGGVGRVLGAGAGAIKGGGGLRSAAGAMAKSTGRAATQTGANVLSKGADAAKGLVGKVGGALTKIPGAEAASKLLGRAAPGVGAALYGMDAVNRAKKGDWGGAALSGLGAGLSLAPGVGTLASLAPAGVQMATDAMGLTGDKSRGQGAAKTAPSGNKFNAAKAAGGQASFKAGGGAAAMKANPSLSAADVQKAGNQALFKAGGGKAAMAQKGQTQAQVMAQGSKNVAAAKAPKPAAVPAPKPASSTPAPKPAAPSKPNLSMPAGLSQGPKQTPDQVKASQASVDADVKAANTPAALNKPAPAGSALGAEQQRRQQLSGVQATNSTASNSNSGTTAFKPPGAPKTPTELTATQQKPSPKPASSSKSSDDDDDFNEETYYVYDVVMEYLLDTGHAETIAEAQYIMTELDDETIESILEGYKDFPTAKVMNKAGKLMGSAAGKTDPGSKKKEKRGIKMMDTMAQHTPDR